jgi:hypothetical protein
MSPANAAFTFGGAALVLFALVYFFYDRFRDKQGSGSAGTPVTGPRPFNITFARLFGLLTVAILGVGLALSKGGNKDLTASAFTLLGTVAGYLAGAKASASPIAAGPAAGAGEGPDPQPPVAGLMAEHL